MATNRRLASGSRRSPFTSFRCRVTRRSAAGWISRSRRWATSNSRRMFTGCSVRNSGLGIESRPPSTGKPSIIAPAQADAGQSQEWLALMGCLDRRAEDARQIADALGDEEIMLHQPFDAAGAGMVGIADAPRQLRLQIEGQPLLCPAGQEMQMAAQRPQKGRRLLEDRRPPHRSARRDRPGPRYPRPDRDIWRSSRGYGDRASHPCPP